MPGAIILPFPTPEDNAKDSDAEMVESVPLHLPSGLDPEARKRVCLWQVAEHEQLLRMAQPQDSLIELRHTHKVRCKLMMNHYMQITGQGQHANTCSRSVLNSVKGRIAKFVECYRVTYRALLQLDPTGNWQEVYLELKDADNRGPGKEADEGGVGDGSYFRSWIWLLNLRVPDSVDGDLGEEGALEEDVNEALRVEWTTSFARLERWNEEVDLLGEMRRVVMFMEWKSQDWLAKADASRADLTPDVQSGLSAYAKKQAAIHCDLAVSFAKLWSPTLTSYGLQHSWNTEYLVKNGVSLDESETTALSMRGIFKFRFGDESHKGISTAGAVPSFAGGAANDCPTFEVDSDCGKDSGLEDSDLEDGDSESEDDWDGDLDLVFFART